jgi:hypothetical protein
MKWTNPKTTPSNSSTSTSPSSGLATAATADVTTRRQAAADILQVLIGSGCESEMMEIVGTWIGTGLGEYNVQTDTEGGVEGEGEG